MFSKVPNWLSTLVLICTAAACIMVYNMAEVYRDIGCLNGCHQSDERLVKLIRDRFIVPPSTLPYNFQSNPPDLSGQINQASYVDSLLGNQTSGFFVECGAYTGELISNSLLFELRRNWSGILIEAEPKNFQELLTKNRKAYALGACLSVGETSAQVEFLSANMVGGIQSVAESGSIKAHRLNTPDKSVVAVQCFPVYAVLQALGNPVVDYFSLDVEGAEMSILRTIPWDKVRIRVWTIEFAGDVELKREITEYMVGRDYVMVKELDYDLVFAHKDVKLNVHQGPDLQKG